MKPIGARIAVNVKKIREQKSMTQDDLATKTGLTVGYVSLIESGQRSPSMGALSKLAKGLGVAEADLVKEV